MNRPWKIYLFALLLLCAPLARAATLTQGIFVAEFHEDDATVAEQSLDVLVAAQAEFAARLPAGKQPIRIIIAHTMGQFMEHASAFSEVSVAGIARSREGLIVLKGPRLLNIESDYRGTLRHELIHVLLYRNTNPRHLPAWLNEGLSMQLANEFRWSSAFRVGQMFFANRIIPYHELDASFRSPGNDIDFGDAYAQALSMTRHLHNTLGEETLWKVVLGTKERPFDAALQHHAGTTVFEFWQSYDGSLSGIALMTTLASGSLLGPAAFLLILAFIRKQYTNRQIYKRWEREEAEGINDTPRTWDEILAEDEDEYWVEEYEDDEYY